MNIGSWCIRNMTIVVVCGAMSVVMSRANGDAAATSRASTRAGEKSGAEQTDVEKLKRALDESVREQVDAALSEMELRILLAEAYLLQTGEGNTNAAPHPASDKARDAAIEQYRKILEFPLLRQPYSIRVDDFKKLYTRAAVRIVELTPVAELKTLRFYPFVLEEIRRTLPEKGKNVSPVPPEVAEFQKRIAFWLDLKMKEEPMDSSIWPHLKAVADYIARDAKR